MKSLILGVMVALLPHNKPDPEQCIEHGVNAYQLSSPMQPVISVIKADSMKELRYLCATRTEKFINVDIRGCLRGTYDRGFQMFYLDDWGLIHEWCHVFYGPEHL